MIRLLKGVLGIALLSISLSSVYAAPVHQEHIFPSTTGAIGKCIGENIRIRTYPDCYARVQDTVSNQKVHVIGQNEEWYKVTYLDKEGWVSKQLVSVEADAFIPHSRVLGEEIVTYGKQFLGTPYVWGGNDLRTGVDCSGLTKELYGTFDIHISRVSYMQAEDGKTISKDELRPGDLVFFDTSGVNRGNISHVGMYIGNGKFLHADCTHGVMISSLSSNYYRQNYVSSSRILHV